MPTNRSAPPVTVTPALVYPDVREAVAWMERALGFEERVRIGEADPVRVRRRAGAVGRRDRRSLVTRSARPA